MPTPDELRHGLTELAGPPADPGPRLARVLRRVQRRRQIGAALGVVTVLGVSSAALQLAGDESPDRVDTVTDPEQITSTTAKEDADSAAAMEACAEHDTVNGDLDGDGVDDAVWHASREDEMVLGICTSTGIVDEIEGVDDFDVLELIDPDGDGTQLIVFGDDTGTYDYVEFAVVVDGELRGVTEEDGSRLSWIDGYMSDPNWPSAYGCSDAGHLQLADGEVSGDALEWWRQRFVIEGSTATRAGTDNGVEALEADVTAQMQRIAGECGAPGDPPVASDQRPLVWASSDGVTLVDADGAAQQITDEPATAARAIGSTWVIFKPHAPEPSPILRIWSNGQVTDVPVSDEVSLATILDARTVDGVPTLLVAERFGTGPDMLEELARYDLRTMERTSVLRQPTWEQGHYDGWLTPDGDVVALLTVFEGKFLERWRAGQEEPTWSIDFPSDPYGDVGLVVDDTGAASVVAIEGPPEGSDPVLAVTPIDDANGSAGPTQRADVADDSIGLDVRCTAWLSDDELACGGSGDPIAIGLDGSVRTLDAPRSALPGAVTEPRQ